MDMNPMRPEHQPNKELPLNLDLTNKQLKADITKCNYFINQSLGASDVPLIEKINQHITKKPGKRLRSLTCIIMAKALDYQEEKLSHHALLGAIIELIHTATLLHDDVIDDSKLRRGLPTANNIWGNTASILTGDFLYSRAFQLMNKIGSLAVMSELADTSNQIAQGEMLQLTSINNPDITIEHYLKVITLKTAKLFEASAKLAAIISQQPAENIELCANFGKHLGVAFQLIDDILDYTSSEENLGKCKGDDFFEGKPTLPILLAIQNAEQNSDTQQADFIKALFRNNNNNNNNNINNNNLDKILDILHKSKSLEKAKHHAQTEINTAKQYLEFLPESIYKTMLYQLCNLAIARIN